MLWVCAIVWVCGGSIAAVSVVVALPAVWSCGYPGPTPTVVRPAAFGTLKVFVPSPDPKRVPMAANRSA